jgi:hypothetical protein
MRRSQAFAALGAASLQDQPSVLGRHPRAKTVRLCPAAIVRLKSAFRHSCLFSTLKKSVRLTAEALSVKKARLDFMSFEPIFLSSNSFIKNARSRFSLLLKRLLELESAIRLSSRRSK